MEGDEAVAEGPLVHGLVEDDVLREDDHGDVLKLAQPLHDLSHGLGLGLLDHGTDPNHDQTLRVLNHRTRKTKAMKTMNCHEN